MTIKAYWLWRCWRVNFLCTSCGCTDLGTLVSFQIGIGVAHSLCHKHDIRYILADFQLWKDDSLTKMHIECRSQALCSSPYCSPYMILHAGFNTRSSTYSRHVVNSQVLQAPELRSGLEYFTIDADFSILAEALFMIRLKAAFINFVAMHRS